MAATTAPAHYIRSIHTSFTAAHPRNAHHTSWASRSSQAQLLHTTAHRDIHADNHHLQYNHHQQHSYQLQNQQYVQPGSINTHNQHNYAHHLQALNALHGTQNTYQGQQPPAYQQGGYQIPLRRRQSGSRLAGVIGQQQQQVQTTAGPGGRRRSASIRMPPTYVVPATQRGRTTTQNYKFDPFADDDAPLSLSVTTPLTGSSQANRLSTTSIDDLKPQYTPAAPYTIHIPAAQPTEIQRYTPAPPSSPRPAARSAALRSLIPINGPLPGTAPTSTASSTTLSRSPSPPSPSTPRNTLSRSPSPPGASASASSTGMGPPKRLPQTNPNLSKIVAGILLNRVHAVGKPMRRRVLPRAQETDVQEYRKSCLSSVISVEA